jgi:hypothetical protein
MTATAEWYRFLAEAAFRPRAPSRTTITSDGSRSSSPISAARNGLAAVGLALPRPSRRTWPAFQDVGAALCRAGWSGLLASSAARPGAQIVWPPAGCEPLRAVEIAEVPTPADRHDHLIRDALANSAMPSVCDSARHGYITSPHPRAATGRVARSPAAAASLRHCRVGAAACRGERFVPNPVAPRVTRRAHQQRHPRAVQVSRNRRQAAQSSRGRRGRRRPRRRSAARPQCGHFARCAGPPRGTVHPVSWCARRIAFRWDRSHAGPGGLTGRWTRKPFELLRDVIGDGSRPPARGRTQCQGRSKVDPLAPIEN